MTRQRIGDATNVPSFKRDGLEAIRGIDTRTVRTLESLPQSRDTITQSINDLVDDTNAIEVQPILLFDDPTDPILTNVRKLVGGDNVSADVGATEVALDLTDTPVTPDEYGAPDKLIILAVDAKGRITAASEVALESGNVTETTNLFFTVARARSALSGGSGINYNPASGVIATTGFTGGPALYTSLEFANGICVSAS